MLETMNKVNPLEHAVYDHMNYLSIDCITLFERRISLKWKA